MIKKKNILLFLLYVYAFIYVFNPFSIYGLGSIYFVYFVTIFLYFSLYRDFNFFILNKRVFILLCFIIIIILHLLILYSFFGEEALKRVYSFILIIFSLISAIGIVVIFKKYISNKMEDFIIFLINLSVFQLIFVFLSIFIPEFRNWALSFTPEDTIFLSNDMGAGIRSFGFASGYTSSFPMMMGLASLFCVFLSLKTKKIFYKIIYVFIFVLLVFSVAINARIGLVPALLSLFFIPLILIRKLKLNILLVLLVFLSFVYFYVMDYIADLSYMERLNQGINEVKVLLFDKEFVGTFQVLRDMWIFPADLMNFYFGGGINTVGNNYNNSDIGLIQDIFMFGLVFTLFFGVLLFYCFSPLLKYMKYYFGFIFIFIFIFSIFIFYMKGLVFYSNELVRFLFLMMLFAYTLNFKKSHLVGN